MMVFLSLLILVSILAITDAVDVKLHSVHGGNVRQGSQYEVYCTFKNIDSHSHSFYWERLNEGGSWLAISSDRELTDAFKLTGRYNVTLKYTTPANFNDMVAVYTLKITNIQPEDTSKLRCRTQDISDSLDLTVYAEPIIQLNGFQAGQKVQFLAIDYKNKGAKFTCSFTGAYPPPVVKVLLGFEDVTSSFQVKRVTRQIGTQGISGTVYDITAKSDNFPIRSEFDQIRLRCQSQSLPYLPVEKAITMEVLSAPRLNCGGLNAAKAWLGERNVSIACYVFSNPHANVINWSWEDKTLGVGKPAVDGISTSQVMLNTSTEVILTFDQIRREDFSRTFKLFASNVYGNDTTHVRLNQVNRVTGGSQPMHLSTVTLLMVLVLQFC